MIVCVGRVGFDGALGFWPNIVLPEEQQARAGVVRPDLMSNVGPFRGWYELVQIGAERCNLAAWRKHKNLFVKAFQYRQVSLGEYARWPRAVRQARITCS